ncbi:hypothetical protein LINGRAHAP2_LOCUS8598, partial [Linum grandiflorum]
SRPRLYTVYLTVFSASRLLPAFLNFSFKIISPDGFCETAMAVISIVSLFPSSTAQTWTQSHPQSSQLVMLCNSHK